MKTLAAAALLVTTALPSAASAQIFLGVRGGYAIPWGDVMTSRPLSDTVKSQLPVQLDLGLKLGKALGVGAYASYGLAQRSAAWRRECDARGSDCSAATLRIGAQLDLHAENTASSELWGGVAAGYEELRTRDPNGLVPEVAFKGYDATLQGGFDLLVSPEVRIGPFVSVTVGRFDRVKAAAEAEITSKELHGWLQLGVRGMFAN